MPNSIISSVLNAAQFRIYDDRSGDQIWKSLGILSVNTDSESANSQKPLSNIQLSGNATFNRLQSTDVEGSKIIRPSMIKVVGMVPDITTTEAILSAWGNVFLTVTLQSRGVIAENMTVTNVVIEQSPEWTSADRITIELEQIAIPSIMGYRPSQQADKSAVGLKIQTPNTTAQNVAAIYNRVNQLTGIF